jgi:hypothetical protein
MGLLEEVAAKAVAENTAITERKEHRNDRP